MSSKSGAAAPRPSATRRRRRALNAPGRAQNGANPLRRGFAPSGSRGPNRTDSPPRARPRRRRRSLRRRGRGGPDRENVAVRRAAAAPDRSPRRRRRTRSWCAPPTATQCLTRPPRREGRRRGPRRAPRARARAPRRTALSQRVGGRQLPPVKSRTRGSASPSPSSSSSSSSWSTRARRGISPLPRWTSPTGRGTDARTARSITAPSRSSTASRSRFVLPSLRASARSAARAASSVGSSAHRAAECGPPRRGPRGRPRFGAVLGPDVGQPLEVGDLRERPRREAHRGLPARREIQQRMRRFENGTARRRPRRVTLAPASWRTRLRAMGERGKFAGDPQLLKH